MMLDGSAEENGLITKETFEPPFGALCRKFETVQKQIEIYGSGKSNNTHW